jgi:polyisoprenoid-binding protein YceI
MSSSPTQTLPLAQGTWTVDKNHSGISFAIKHLGLTNVRGRFDRFDATLVVGDGLDDVKVTADVDLSSVNTNQPDRDAHLMGTDFFHADSHPMMTFASTKIVPHGSEEYELTGDLTINGITKPVTFHVDFEGSEVFPADQKLHAGFTLTGELRRGDFGIDFNMPIGLHKVALGEKVKIEIDVQFVEPSA